jgi:hypothetical protein
MTSPGYFPGRDLNNNRAIVTYTNYNADYSSEAPLKSGCVSWACIDK